MNYEKSHITGDRELPGHLPDNGLEGVQRTRRCLRFSAHQGHSQGPGAWLCHPGGFPISIPGREHHTGQYCSCRLQTGNLTFLDDHHSPDCKGILGTQREPCLHIPSDFGRSVISSAGIVWPNAFSHASSVYQPSNT